MKISHAIGHLKTTKHMTNVVRSKQRLEARSIGQEHVQSERTEASNSGYDLEGSSRMWDDDFKGTRPIMCAAVEY